MYFIKSRRLWLQLVQVRVGSNYNNKGGIIIAVERSITHENYDGSTSDYDISLLKVSSVVSNVFQKLQQ